MHTRHSRHNKHKQLSASCCRESYNMGPSLIRPLGDFSGGCLPYFPSDVETHTTESALNSRSTRVKKVLTLNDAITG